VLLDLPLGNILVAGVAVSVVLGGLAVLPLHAMARRVWDERVATVAGLLYALLPAAVDVHAEPMTEGTFLFFFLSAAWMGWRGLEERSWEMTAVAAGASALAWLSRPEGIYLLPLFLLAAVLRFSRFSVPAVAVFAAVWLVLAFPYLCFIHGETGHWRLSLSPIPVLITKYLGGERVVGLAEQEFEPYRSVARYGVVLGGGKFLFAHFFGKALFYVLGPFLVIGLARPRPGDGQRPLLAYGWLAAAGYMVPIVLSFAASTPFSHRFLLAPVAFLLPTIAAGVVRAADWTRRPRALPLLAGALCLAMAAWDARVRRAEKIGVKEAGEAILQSLGPGRRLYTTNRAAEFYARAEHVEAPIFVSLDDVEKLHPDAIVICPRDLRATEDRVEERLAERHPRMGEFPSPPQTGTHPVRVYLGTPR
jgi:4-amino-4-deoxy-L-arabinose transferase-like glycosyltransferase